MNELPPETPENLSELLWYIMHWKNDIFFRPVRDGKGVLCSVAKLTPKEFGDKVAQVIQTGAIPVRVIRHQPGQ